MKDLSFDALVIGGGAAGMAAALELAEAGFSCALLEREGSLGGVLMQCLHNGFGLIEFKEELTGPEFAQRLEEKILASGVTLFLSTTVLEMETVSSPHRLTCASPEHGMMRLNARALILAMGCREKNRGNLRIPGSRPAGVYTAGLAQRLVNIDGFLPGREAVIIGSGDIGLIMARRLSWSDCVVKAVIEIQAFPSGLPRNVAQCLEDFNIPLRLSHATTRILGKDRVSGVEIAPLENGFPNMDKAQIISCDTILLSVGLVPENEISRQAGILLNPMTGGAQVDARLMTSAAGVFACGNALHVHDLVDYATEEARRAGAWAAAWLRGDRAPPSIRLVSGPNVRYLCPTRAELGRKNKIYLRPLIVKSEVKLEVKLNGSVVESINKRHVRPSEMLWLELDPARYGHFEGEAELEIGLS